jgi:hypothetical protein
MKNFLRVVLSLVVVIAVFSCAAPGGGGPDRAGSLTSTGGVEYVFTPSTMITPALYAIAYGNGTYVAVGPYTNVITSSDGTDWIQTQTNNSSIAGWKVPTHPARARGVATGKAGKLPPAPRTLLPSDPAWDMNGDLWDVAFGAGIFIVVGTSGAWSSVDGTSWSYIDSLDSCYDAGCLTSIDYVNGRFMATWQGEGTSVVLTSTNGGVSWTEMELPNSDFYSGVAYGSVAGVPTYVTVSWSGTIATSVNGVGQMGTYPIPYYFDYVSLTSVAYANGLFVAVGTAWNNNINANSLLILVSSDGLSWTSQDLAELGNPPGYIWQDANNYSPAWCCANIAASGSSFMIVANYIYPWYGEGTEFYPGAVVLAGTTGRTWAYQYWNTALSGVTWGDGFYAVAQGDPVWQNYGDGLYSEGMAF